MVSSSLIAQRLYADGGAVPRGRDTSRKVETLQTVPQTLVVPQSLAPGATISHSDTDVFNRIDNSLVANYLDTDSYMAKVTGGGMTNSKALQVLAEIERKLAGMSQC